MGEKEREWERVWVGEVAEKGKRKEGRNGAQEKGWRGGRKGEGGRHGKKEGDKGKRRETGEEEKETKGGEEKETKGEEDALSVGQSDKGSHMDPRQNTASTIELSTCEMKQKVVPSRELLINKSKQIKSHQNITPAKEID